MLTAAVRGARAVGRDATDEACRQLTAGWRGLA